CLLVYLFLLVTVKGPINFSTYYVEKGMGHIFPVLPPDRLTRADNGSLCTPNPWGKSMWIKEQKKQYCIMVEVYYLQESRKCKELFLKETLLGYLARTACWEKVKSVAHQLKS